jgi:hypothetical protein
MSFNCSSFSLGERREQLKIKIKINIYLGLDLGTSAAHESIINPIATILLLIASL